MHAMLMVVRLLCSLGPRFGEGKRPFSHGMTLEPPNGEKIRAFPHGMTFRTPNGAPGETA